MFAILAGIKAIAGPLFGMATDWLRHKRELASAKATAAIELEKKRVEADINWEVTQAQGADYSWKDELWTIVFVGMILANFVPSLQPYMQQGYANMEQMPDWLKWGTVASISAAFGLRAYVKHWPRSTGMILPKG